MDTQTQGDIVEFTVGGRQVPYRVTDTFLLHGRQYALLCDAQGDRLLARVVHPCTPDAQYIVLGRRQMQRLLRHMPPD